MGEPMRTVLVADSASIVQFILERILGKEGYRVLYTKHPRDLVHQVQVVNPDVIVLQAEIGGGKGYRICEYLNRRPETRHIPIILTTRITKTLDFESWPGVVAVLRKPLSAARVWQALGKVPEAPTETESQADAI